MTEGDFGDKIIFTRDGGRKRREEAEASCCPFCKIERVYLVFLYPVTEYLKSWYTLTEGQGVIWKA